MGASGTEPVRQSEVVQVMGDLDVAITNLESVVEDLEPSLARVLREDDQERKPGEEKPETTLCPLAHDIRLMKYRVLKARIKIRSLLDLVEI